MSAKQSATRVASPKQSGLLCSPQLRYADVCEAVRNAGGFA
jgi:hypothetical protein